LEIFKESRQQVWNYFITTRVAYEKILSPWLKNEIDQDRGNHTHILTYGSPTLGYNISVGEVSVTTKELADFAGPDGSGLDILKRNLFVFSLSVNENGRSRE